MTGGFGHVRDMQIRDKNNKGLLQSIKDLHKKVARGLTPSVSYDKIVINEDKIKLSESSQAEINKIRKEARRTRIVNLIAWSITLILLLALFCFLITRIL